MFNESEDTYSLALYIKDNDASIEALVAYNLGFPAIFFHELVEGSLAHPSNKNPIRSDAEPGSSPAADAVGVHYTRWFREGFSNYVGYLAYRMLVTDPAWNSTRFLPMEYQEGLHAYPFSSLAHVGTDLFTWLQFTKEPKPWKPPTEPHVGKTALDYYDAAFGLFLVIEANFGQDRIREIINAIPGLARADGSDLIRLVNDTLQTDIVQLVADFSFPGSGIYLVPCARGGSPATGVEELELRVMHVQAGSRAEDAGLRRWDIIQRVNGTRTVTPFDFEMAMYRLRHDETATLRVYRKPTGQLSLRLRLRDPAPSSTPP